MEKFLEKISVLSKNFIEIEESDSQYISLKNLYFNIKNKDFYLSLILANSIICYQLSSTWEKYWDEFSIYFSNIEIKNIDDLILNIEIFIKQSKWNKRFIDTKIKRLNKLNTFLKIFLKLEMYYYENMNILCDDLAKSLNQKITAKTIVFWIKMFWYGSRIKFNKIINFPFDIFIPIDSRLTKIYELYNKDEAIKIEEFYLTLSKKLNIPLLHLDAVIWVNYNKLFF